ncbi:MAG: hypothetical protein OHK0052_10320 [Anaerolineales bacterium]
MVLVLLCGGPGFFSLCFGSMFALISQIPGAEIDVFGSSNPQDALQFGLAILCFGAVFILITAIGIFLTWRRKA